MPGSWLPYNHPRLSVENSVETSLTRAAYNCIAWAAGDQSRWWWPDVQGFAYWPAGVPREVSVPGFIAAFQSLGYELCGTGRLQDGVQKIVLFGHVDMLGQLVPTHAARQLASGSWTSKMGALEDILHTEADLVCGPVYGQLVCFMSRVRTGPDVNNLFPHPNAATSDLL